MKKYFLIFMITILTGTIFAQSEHFSKEVFKIGDKEIPYRFSKPQGYDPFSPQKYPVILFLHGAGERGNDNEIQLTHIDKVFGTEAFRQKYPCFVIVPQCPAEKRWVDVDWNLPSHSQPKEMSEPMKLAISVLYSVILNYRIDSQRVYIVGLSMGGYGTWDLIARFPELFAAAVPICGGGDENTASKIKHIPIWAFHGAKDKAVPVARSRNMINAIKEAGGNPKYSEYPELGHLVWDTAFSSSELWEWLFLQVRKTVNK